MNNIYFDHHGRMLDITRMDDGLTRFDIEDDNGLNTIFLSKGEVSKLIEFLQAIDK